jgi:hypothetical protein
MAQEKRPDKREPAPEGPGRHKRKKDKRWRLQIRRRPDAPVEGWWAQLGLSSWHTISRYATDADAAKGYAAALRNERHKDAWEYRLLSPTGEAVFLDEDGYLCK